MFLIDSHCHLDALDNAQQDLQQILRRAKEMHVQHLLAVAVTLEGAKFLQNWLVDERQISLSCGVHPLNLDSGLTSEELWQYACHPKVIGIGETGLDYYYIESNNMNLRIQQQEAFIEHINVAKNLNKPLIVHTRQASHDTLALLKSEKAQDCRGVLHCFTEDINMARQLLDLGFYISFSGIVTFKNANELRDVAKYIPADRLLVETDSPYLAPIPFRGKVNEPKNVYYVAEFIANLRGVTLTDFARQTSQNFCELFNVKL